MLMNANKVLEMLRKAKEHQGRLRKAKEMYMNAKEGQKS